MDVLRCSAAREWARRVVGRWWSGDLSGLLDAGGGGEVGDGDGLVAVGAWRAWPEPAAELVALLAALAAEVAGVACGALVDTGRAGRRAGLGGWRGGVVAQAPEQYRRRPEATTAVPQTGQVVVTLSSRTGAAAGAGGAQPVGVGAGGDDQRVERQAVDDRSGQARVGEGLAPLAERGIAGHRDGGFLLAFGDDLEQQLRAARVV